MTGTEELTMYNKLIRELQSCPDAKYGCSQCEFQRNLDCQVHLMNQAANVIEKLQDALLLMVLQYCTTNDGLLYNSFMTAGEYAFAVLSVKNGQQADPLWEKLSNEKPPKEES